MAGARERGEWAGGEGTEGTKEADPAGSPGQGADFAFTLSHPPEGLERTHVLTGALWRPHGEQTGQGPRQGAQEGNYVGWIRVEAVEGVTSGRFVDTV